MSRAIYMQMSLKITIFCWNNTDFAISYLSEMDYYAFYFSNYNIWIHKWEFELLFFIYCGEEDITKYDF